MRRAAGSIEQSKTATGTRKALALVAICVTGVLGLCASASAAPTWLSPTTISEGQDPTEAALAVDPSGDAVAAWSNFGSNEKVEASNTTTPGAGWSSPTELAENSYDMMLEPPEPRVAIDSHGDGVAVWEIYENHKWYVQASQMPAGGAWQTPVQLAETNDPGRPQVAFDAQGDALATWTTYSGHDAIEVSELPSGGSWQTPTQISGSGEEAAGAQLAINAGGDAIVAWTTWNGSSNHVVAAELPAGGTWQTPAQISNAGSEDVNPQVAIDEQGDVVAVWEHNNGGQQVVQAAQMPAGGAWQSTASQLSESGEPAYGPQLASNAQGDAVVVWERWDGNGYVDQAAQLPAGGSWQTPVTFFSESDVDGVAPHVAINARGDEVAVWMRWNGSSEIAEASELVAGGTWQTPVELAPGLEESENPRVEMTANGDAVAVWTGYNGSNNVIQAANLVAAGPQLSEVSIPASGLVGQTLSFSVDPLDPWTSLGQTSWSFGDTSTATGTEVTHEYTAPGEYEVTVESSDSLGNVTTEKRKVVVEAPPGPKHEGSPAQEEPVKEQQPTVKPTLPQTTTTASSPASSGPAPALSVLSKEAQPLINSHALSLGATCGPAACTASASGWVKLPGRHKILRLMPFTGPIPADGFGVLHLDVPRHVRRAVRHYLLRHPHYRVELHLTVATTVDGHASHTESLALPIWTYPGFR